MPIHFKWRFVSGTRTFMFGFAFLIVATPSIYASQPRDLVEMGRHIFFNETFDGNGRTCATCHREERNFAIDPVFIATLPDDDPLFVAEFTPALAENFENPRLMREFGLILENNDGFDDLANNFNMRGVPHLLGMQVSIDGPGGAPRTGWSGDGAPASCPKSVERLSPERCDDFDGTLRAFALGAVIQHFPKTLDRTPGSDFRLPTDFELDALEAFQLSLGRQEDLQLPLPLKGTVAARGQEIFLDPDLGKCNRCHKNAGANANFNPNAPSPGNLDFNTGVEALADQPAHLTGEKVPGDDGFGNPGNGAFNTPPVVEAADTGPFFHNNAIETIEGAVAFYNGPAFNNSPAGAFNPINLESTQVVAVAAFLRVINAIGNIDSSIHLLEESRPRKVRLGIVEMNDALRVLEGGGLHAEAIVHLRKAIRVAQKAQRQIGLQRQRLLRRALRRLDAARGELVSATG